MAEEIIIKVDGLQELKNIEATFKTFVTSINAAVTAIGAGGGDKSLLKEIEKLNKEIEKLKNTQRENNKVIDENKVKQQQLNAIEKERIIATSEYSKATERLLAQTKILQREIDSLVKSGQTETALYREKVSQLTKMTQEYDNLQKATGLAQMKQTGMYGATYQLSQVMRELPNFAIDARTGFLSLSNNLPMLLDSFKQLSMQIDEVTGKPKGAKGAFAEFGKSLLGLNTIFVAATTLLTIYGDDIVKFIGTLFKAENSVRQLNDSINDINKSVSVKLASDMENILKFAVNYNTAIKEGNKKRIEELTEIGRKEFSLNDKRLSMIASNVNAWRDAFAEYLEIARKTYWNEARIKDGIEAEMAAKTAMSKRELVEGEIIQKYGEKTGKFYIDEMKKDVNYALKQPMLWGEALLKEWVKINKEIETANKKVKTLSSIKIYPISGKSETTTTPTTKVADVDSTNDKLTAAQKLEIQLAKNRKKMFAKANEEIKDQIKKDGEEIQDEWDRIAKMNEKGFSNLVKSTDKQFREDEAAAMDAHEKDLDDMQKILGAMSYISDSIAGLYDARIEKMNEYYDLEAARIEGSTASEAEKNEMLRKLDERRYQEELQLFEQRKKFQIATIWIDTAAGILSTWTAKPKTMTPLDIAARIAQSLALVAMATTQTANINAQKPNAPKAISGGGSMGASASQSALSPQKTAMTSKEENLNMMLSNKDNATSVVKVSEINDVQNKVSVRENNQMY